jgi:hypothetical protein
MRMHEGTHTIACRQSHVAFGGRIKRRLINTPENGKAGGLGPPASTSEDDEMPYYLILLLLIVVIVTRKADLWR